jgi:hypothetical protein
MQEATLKIYTQYYENINHGSNKEPNWKPNGGEVFEVKIDLNEVGEHDLLKETIQSILKTESTSYEKYEYLNYKVIFGNPKTLSKELFYNILTQKRNKIKVI